MQPLTVTKSSIWWRRSLYGRRRRLPNLKFYIHYFSFYEILFQLVYLYTIVDNFASGCSFAFFWVVHITRAGFVNDVTHVTAASAIMAMHTPNFARHTSRENQSCHPHAARIWPFNLHHCGNDLHQGVSVLVFLIGWKFDPEFVGSRTPTHSLWPTQKAQ